MKLFLAGCLAIAALLFGGCKDTVEISCPDCTIIVVDGVRSYECGGCTVEAKVSEDFKLIQRPERD